MIDWKASIIGTIVLTAVVWIVMALIRRFSR
jgi:hypothetical protein